MDLPIIISLLALGACTGFLAGLLGIGGGMILVPFITIIMEALGIGASLAVKAAIATSMGTIIFTSVASIHAHHKRGAVRWDIVRTISPGIIVGSLLGSMGIFSAINGTTLALVFGIFVAFSATQMLFNHKPSSSRHLPGPAGLFAAGGIIGMLSGLVGAGGGFISVPFMAWCNVALHSAVATSAAIGFPIAVANLTGYVWSGASESGLPPGSFGYVWLPGLAVIVATSMLTAPLGAKVAHRLPVHKLKRIFAVMLYLLAAYMLGRGLTS